jgi:hypothetical protein
MHNLDFHVLSVEALESIRSQLYTTLFVKGGTKLIKEPILKKGGIAKCYNGDTHEILEVSSDYDEVAEYDSTGACAADLEEYKNFEDGLFVAVKCLSNGNNYVFICSRDSEILGD